MRYLRCRACEQQDLTSTYRKELGTVLCAACNVDARTSNVKRKTVEPREHFDRYAALALKHGV